MRLLSSVIASTALYQAHAGFSHTQYLASHGISPLSHAQTSAVLSYPPESLPASLAESAAQVFAACEAPAQELCGTSLAALHTGSPDTAWHLRRRQLDCLARQATLPEPCAAAGEALFEAVAEHQLEAQFQLAVQHVQTLEDQALTVCGLADDAKAQPSCNLTPYAMPSAGSSGSGNGDSGATSRVLKVAMEPATPMQQSAEGKRTRERHGKHKHVRGTDAQEHQHSEDAARMLSKHHHHHRPRDEHPGEGPPPPPAAQLMQFGELVLLRERVHSGMQQKPPITSETKCVASSLNAQAVEATNSMSCQRLAGEYTEALRRVASMPQAGRGEMTGAVCAWPGLVPPPPPVRGHGPPTPPRDGTEEQETGELAREESRTVQGSTTTNTMHLHWRTSDRSGARAMQEQVPPRAPQTQAAPAAGPPGCMPGHEYPDSDFALAAAARPGPHDGHHGHHHRHHSACRDIIGFVVFVAIAVLLVKLLRRVLCGVRGRCHRRHGGPGFWPRRHHHGHMPPPHHHHGHQEHHQELPPMAPPSAQSQAPPPPPPVAPTVVPRSVPVIHGNAPAPAHDPTQLYPTVPSTGGYPHGYGRL